MSGRVSANREDSESPIYDRLAAQYDERRSWATGGILPPISDLDHDMALLRLRISTCYLPIRDPRVISGIGLVS